VKIYPNPVNEKAIISLDAPSDGALTIQFYDMTGRLMLNRKATVEAGNNEIEINTEFLSKGNYVCKIQGREMNIRFKLAK
jgi:hypothetical protein